MEQYDGVALFSGGLDSILAARLLMEQGKRIKCLHFISPFFGKPGQVRHWERAYGLDISVEDVSDDFAHLLADGPVYGFGSVLNPCVDCKILMMRRARARLAEWGASFLVSGEVLGQRPMSQRRDTLNVIRRDAGVRGILLRPLCAQHLDPTEPELSGMVDRSRLLGFSGRGRTAQLALAAQYGITEIPTPGGGCMLTEKENARRYWPVLTRLGRPDAVDFRLSNLGRQFWKEDCWLSVGRHQADNEAFGALVREDDILFKTAGFPGPLALGRKARFWPDEAMRAAAALVASYSPKACRAHEEGQEIQMRLIQGEESTLLPVVPQRESVFREPTWEEARAVLYARRKKQEARPEGD